MWEVLHVFCLFLFLNLMNILFFLQQILHNWMDHVDVNNNLLN